MTSFSTFYTLSTLISAYISKQTKMVSFCLLSQLKYGFYLSQYGLNLVLLHLNEINGRLLANSSSNLSLISYI